MDNHSQSKALAPRPALKAGGALAAFIPQDLEQAWRLSEAFATQSGDMIPKDYRGKPGAVFLAVSKGAEIGLSPLAALQNIAAINGRAVLWGDALPGLLRREGHKITEWLEGTGEQMVAYCKVTRGDSGEEIERKFSVADAKRARLWGKAGPWTDYPQRMLAMRARGYACRDGAADALLGLSIREEVDDYRGPDNAKDVTPANPAENPILQTILSAGDDEPETKREAEPEPEVGTVEVEAEGDYSADEKAHQERIERMAEEEARARPSPSEV